MAAVSEHFGRSRQLFHCSLEDVRTVISVIGMFVNTFETCSRQMEGQGAAYCLSNQ